MELVSVECPNCGAALPPREPIGHYECDYCSTRFELRQARGAKTQYGVEVSPHELAKAIVEAQQRMRQADAAAASRIRDQAAQADGARVARRVARRVVPTVVAITVLGAIIPVVIMLVSAGAVQQAVSQIPGAQNIPAITEMARVTEHLLWDDVAGPPQPVDIRGKPGFIGRTRKVLEDDQLFIDAYDATTVERIWRLGPLGSYSDAYRSTLFAAVLDRVVVSDHRSTLRLLDLATGEEIQSVGLTDRVEVLCAPLDPTATMLWVKQVDERAHLLDVRTGQLTEAKRPKWCHNSRWDAERAAERAPPNKAVPRVEGFKAKHLEVDGSVAVAVGVKHPGTPVPRAVGFDPKTRELRWHEAIPTVDLATVRRADPLMGLGGGRLIATYGEGQDTWHLTGLDATTGARLWDTTLRSLFAVDHLEGLVVTNTHALLTRTSSLEVYDTATGALLGTVGTETYD